MKRIILLAILIPFAACSTWLAISAGYFGFVRVAAREPWALQVLVDLVIACGLITSWMVGDARARGVRVWPYLIATATLGSIGVLAYLVVRESRRPAPIAP